MSDTTESLRRKIAGAENLEAVVRAMKALAASRIGQYERAVQALDDYYRTVELGLAACFRQAGAGPFAPATGARDAGAMGIVVFGSDQGLVGQFNEVLATFVIHTLGGLPGKVSKTWAVGERVHALMADTGLPLAARLPVPISVDAITPLVGQILVEIETAREQGDLEQVYLFHNQPQSGAAYAPVRQRLLPLDNTWRSKLAAVTWPTKRLPEVIHGVEPVLRALIRGYLFVLLFQACAQSLASENASRLAAMQRAEKNIKDTLEDFSRTFHRLRQGSIDEELFDVISGYEVSSEEAGKARGGASASRDPLSATFSSLFRPADRLRRGLG